MDLTNKKCIPCEVGGKALPPNEVVIFARDLLEWKIENNLKIKREITFKDFKEAMAFVNKVAAIAESEGHHPDIYIYYNKVNLELTTHEVKGLTENDFIVAAKIDKLLS